MFHVTKQRFALGRNLIVVNNFNRVGCIVGGKILLDFLLKEISYSVFKLILINQII